jgi:hypothetical protein
VQQAALVYGSDDRQEYGQANSTFQQWADSVAQLVHKDQVSCASGTCTLTRQKWTKDFVTNKRLCSGVRYRAQLTLAFGGVPPVGGFCTGFLVAPDLIVSAAHCLHMALDCPFTKFVFGYTANSSGGGIPASVPQDNVYQCVEQTNLYLFTDEDWIVYRLDRPVSDRFPLPIRHSGEIAGNAPLAIIGHPNGLPLKVSPVGTVTATSDPLLFAHNVESFKGNSGSPVFDRDSGIVEGIEVLGAPNIPQFVDGTDAQGPCVKEKVCSMTTGCPGFSRSTRIALISDLVPLTPAQIMTVLGASG